MTDRLDNWIQTGPGGGGRTMWCRMSPHDPEALISTGDMGGVFHSASGGADWRFLPSREIEYVAFDNGFDPWEFIPSRPGEVWTGSRTRGLLRSRNSGADWESVPGPWDELTRCDFSHWVGPDIVRFSPDGQRALAGWSACGDASRRVLMRSSDAGEHWEEIAPGLSSGPVKAIHFLSDELALILTGTESYCCYLVPGALERTAVHWEGTIFASADTRTSILAVTRDGSGRTRLYRIGEDLSFRQLPACVDGIELSIFVVGASFSADRVIYLGAFEAKDASGNLLLPATLWKSEDGGASWRNTLERRVDRTLNIDRKHWTTGEWGWDTAPQSVCVDTGNPDLVTFTDPTMISAHGSSYMDSVTGRQLKSNSDFQTDDPMSMRVLLGDSAVPNFNGCAGSTYKLFRTNRDINNGQAKLNLRHNDSANAMFCDLHVGSITKTVAEGKYGFKMIIYRDTPIQFQ